MKITFRRYKLLQDFDIVNDFLINNYSKEMDGCIEQPFWEYAHTHPCFNHKLTHRFGLWEDDGKLVAIAFYEMDIGEVLIYAADGYEFLYENMLNYAEKELSIKDNDVISIGIFTSDKQTILRDLLISRGYKSTYKDAVNIFPYEKGFKNYELPEGFSIISLEDENDFYKINSCLWKGFNHGDEPDDDIDGRMQMQSGPNFRKDLTTVIKAPNGEYACFAGMWIDGKNGYAYLEPLATVPYYRKLGLASIALTVAMKKTIPFGAKYCIGGSIKFYTEFGFETIGYKEKWLKQW